MSRQDLINYFVKIAAEASPVERGGWRGRADAAINTVRDTAGNVASGLSAPFAAARRAGEAISETAGRARDSGEGFEEDFGSATNPRPQPSRAEDFEEGFEEDFGSATNPRPQPSRAEDPALVSDEVTETGDPSSVDPEDARRIDEMLDEHLAWQKPAPAVAPDEASSGGRGGWRGRVDDAINTARDAAGEVGETVTDAARRAGDAISETAGRARDAAVTGARTVSDAASDTYESAKDTGRKALDTVNTGARNLYSKAKNSGLPWGAIAGGLGGAGLALGANSLMGRDDEDRASARRRLAMLLALGGGAGAAAGHFAPQIRNYFNPTTPSES